MAQRPAHAVKLHCQPARPLQLQSYTTMIMIIQIFLGPTLLCFPAGLSSSKWNSDLFLEACTRTCNLGMSKPLFPNSLLPASLHEARSQNYSSCWRWAARRNPTFCLRFFSAALSALRAARAALIAWRAPSSCSPPQRSASAWLLASFLHRKDNLLAPCSPHDMRML